jgi:CHAD domain-containing protein
LTLSTPHRSASQRAERALSRATSDRRLIAGAAATAGAALAAGVARELIGRNGAEGDASSPSPTYRIKRSEAPTEAITRIAYGRIDHALERLQQIEEEEVGPAVHEARKDIKKVRSVLRLVRDPLGKNVYRRQNSRLRKAARALSGSRDAEAKVETLDALEERFGDAPPDGFAVLRAALEEERDALVAAEGDADSDLRRAAGRTVTELTAAREAVRGWDFTSSGWKLMSPGLKRSYRRGRSRFHDVLADPSPAKVHEWRKRVKDHWYHLRLLRNSWREVLEDMGDQAHQLADLLGDHHDLTVLADDARKRPELATDAEQLTAVMETIGARQEELLDAAVPIGERCYAEPPNAFVKRMRTYWRAWRAE